MSLITLTTDFGEASPYVAVMKGIILSINPSTTILDLTHLVPPQNIRHGSYFLGTALPYFPSNTIHVAVVDPGVGTDRDVLLVKTEAQYIIAPDNGLLTMVLDRHPPTKIWKLTESRFWRSNMSDTFHGRDIIAPVAGNLALERKPERFGVEVKTWQRLEGAPVESDGNLRRGSIQFVDHFGNLISNIPSRSLTSLPTRLKLAGQVIDGMKWVRTYGEGAPGELVGLKSSDGFFEVAVVNGNAAERLNIAAGAAVELVLGD